MDSRIKLVFDRRTYVHDLHERYWTKIKSKYRYWTYNLWCCTVWVCVNGFCLNICDCVRMNVQVFVFDLMKDCLLSSHIVVSIALLFINMVVKEGKTWKQMLMFWFCLIVSECLLHKWMDLDPDPNCKSYKSNHNKLQMR